MAFDWKTAELAIEKALLDGLRAQIAQGGAFSFEHDGRQQNVQFASRVMPAVYLDDEAHNIENTPNDYELPQTEVQTYKVVVRLVPCSDHGLDIG